MASRTQKSSKKLSSKDREIKKFLNQAASNEPSYLPPRPEGPARALVVPIPKKVDLSIHTLNRLADHCEQTGKKMSYCGFRIV